MHQEILLESSKCLALKGRNHKLLANLQGSSRFEATIPPQFSNLTSNAKQTSASSPKGHSSLSGAVVDGNLVQAFLCSGRSGFYYRLDSTGSNSRAIKFVPFELAKQEFLAELASKCLIHPNIVRVESGGQHRELKIGPLAVFPGDRTDEKSSPPPSKPRRYRYLILEWIQGDQKLRSFKDLKVEGGLPSQQLLHLAIPVFQALAYAHQQGFVHGKLHPSSLLLTSDHTPKITKFRSGLTQDLAKASGNPPILDSDSEWVSYIAPEQLQRSRSTGPSADLYSLAVILYELLSGHLPHQGNPIIGHLAGESQALPSRDDISTDLQAWFEIALQKEACHRFSDMQQAADALRSALGY